MGMGPIYRAFDNVNQQMLAEQQRQWQQQLAGAATQPIPGLTGPTTPMGGGLQQPVGTPTAGMPPSSIPGLPMPTTTQRGPGMPPAGPYGRQAMMMAGLLGRPGEGYPSGLLGGKRGPFRPGGK